MSKKTGKANKKLKKAQQEEETEEDEDEEDEEETEETESDEESDDDEEEEDDDDAPKSKKKGKGKKEKKAKKKKPLIGGTEEEFAAAVAGELEAREVKGKKDQESLGATSEDGKPKGRPLGITTGLPIMLAWCYIFQQNDRAKKSDKMTDAEISKWMKKEFPGREAAVFDQVQMCRNLYNKGRFTKGVEPEVQSVGYDDAGEEVEVRARGAAAKKSKKNEDGDDDRPSKKSSKKDKKSKKSKKKQAEEDAEADADEEDDD